jgi:CheY-like chemotaxis protein
MSATVERPPVSSQRLVLYVEDDPKARDTVEEAVQRHALPFVSVGSVAEANEFLEDPDFRFGLAFVDQRLPREREGLTWAEDEEVDELATRLAERGPIVWLTAHEVDINRMGRGECLGEIQKAGDVSGEVEAYLLDAIGPPSADVEMDEVLVEMSDLRPGTAVKPGTVSVRVPTWRPDESFEMNVRHVESWVLTILRDGGNAYFSARGWLGAERPLQLDLTDWHHIPNTVAVNEEFWYDDAD